MSEQFAKAWYRTTDPAYHPQLRGVFHRVNPHIPGVAQCRRSIDLDMETLISERPSDDIYCIHCSRKDGDRRL